MGVATGASTQTTSATVPPDLPTGQCQLVVIANGIASNPVTVVVHSPPPVGGIIVWHHQQTGETQIWQMNGNQLAGRATVVDEQGNPTFVGLPFEIVGVGRG